MIPLLGVFRILAIVILGKLHFLLLLSAALKGLIQMPVAFSVGTDFGFAFYRRFATDETGLKV